VLSQQRSQSEETVTKLKQLLMKTKKEMAEGQRREEGLRTSLEDIRGQLEQERQEAEQAKVELANCTAKIETLKQQVGGAYVGREKDIYNVSTNLMAKLWQKY